MDIIAICGSPRRGNTEFALKRFLTIADELGHNTELVLLRDKKIEHCRGCLCCTDGEKCNIVDDMNLIMEQVKRNTLIVLGSPNYFSNVSGLMKDFIDRLHPCCFNGNILNGKKIIGIFVGEDFGEENKAIAAIESVAEKLDMYFIGDLYLKAKNDQDLENNKEELKKLENFTNNVLK